MFFTLSKIFAVFLKPIIWIILLMVITFFVKRKTLRVILRMLALLMLLGFTNSYLTRKVVQAWEKPLVAQSEIVLTYEVGIVLGGGIVQSDDSTGELVFRGNTDRILKAIELYKSGKIRKILISGGDGSYFRYMVPEAQLLKEYISDNGLIPVYDILVDTISRNTHENAVEVKKVLKDSRIRGTSLLITSGIHMRRSLACFEKEEVPVVPFVSNQLFLNSRSDFEFYVVPKLGNLWVWHELFHEWFGWFFYRIAGYV